MVAAVDQILRRRKEQNADNGLARELVEGGYIVGIDSDPKAVTAARLHLWQRLIDEPHALPLPNLSEVIVKADGLFEDTWGALNQKYDIVLGNPPFLAVGFVPNREQVERKFSSAQGRYDFSSLFVEQATNVLAEGGHLGMVVPNRLYKNAHARAIRDVLVRRTALLTLVDFGSTKPFDASSYIGCIVARRRSADTALPQEVRVIEVRSLAHEYLAKIMLDADAGPTDDESVRAYWARHPQPDQQGRPWTLLSAADRRTRVLIEEASVPLETIALVPQGVRTGANDLFVFEVLSDDGFGMLELRNGLDETDVLEGDLLEPVVFGAHVRRYRPVGASNRLLYPYRNNVPIPEVELERSFPATWAYLLRNRDLLAARASLKKAGRRWYELVWPRDEAWLRKPKLLIRDLAPRTSFAPDEVGTTFLVGGTAVVPEEPEKLLPLLAYLNSTPIDTLIKRSTPVFGGNFQKFEPQHLLSVPVLRSLIEDEQFSGRLAQLAARIAAIHAADGGSEAQDLEREVDEAIKNAADAQGIDLEA